MFFVKKVGSDGITWIRLVLDARQACFCHRRPPKVFLGSARVMAELDMHEGFDVVLEMSGVPSAVEQMLDVINHGGKIAMLGIPPGEMAIDWTKVIFKGLTIRGIYGREMFETWYKMASLIQSGLDLSPIITHRLGVADFQQGFEIMGSGQSGKVVLDWG